MSAQVKVTNGELAVAGHGRIISIGAVLGDILDCILFGTLEGSGEASLASLRRALITWRRWKLSNGSLSAGDSFERCRVWIGVFQTPEEESHRRWEEAGRSSAVFDEYLDLPPSSPTVYLDGERLRVRIQLMRPERPDLRKVRRLLAPFLERRRASSEIHVAPAEDGGRGFLFTVDFDSAFARGATLADAWRLGDEAQALLQAADGDELPRSTALDLLRAGRWDLFNGQPESGWLEAKGAPYDHLFKRHGLDWRYELAKDVAAFANSPDGGLVVLGLTTRDSGDGDVIRGHKEFDLRRVRASAYRRHIAHLVYPRVSGFEVVRIKGRRKGFGLAVLVVPAQPQSSKPFLVQGTISDGKVLGSHVLLPVRREDDSALMDAGALHARIRLGEQAIAGEAED